MSYNLRLTGRILACVIIFSTVYAACTNQILFGTFNYLKGNIYHMIFLLLNKLYSWIVLKLIGVFIQLINLLRLNSQIFITLYIMDLRCNLSYACIFLSSDIDAPCRFSLRIFFYHALFSFYVFQQRRCNEFGSLMSWVNMERMFVHPLLNKSSYTSEKNCTQTKAFLCYQTYTK